MKTDNFCFIVCGPSGVGKTTLVKDLLEDTTNRLALSVSYTTRAPRGTEADGRDYFFVDVETFDAMIAGENFAEWANVHNNKYGTATAQIEDAWSKEYNVLFDIDYQGARQLKERYGERAIAVLVLPPSIAELESRLRGRGTDSEETIQLRLKNAVDEMRQVGLFDYVVRNDELEIAKAKMDHIYHASACHRSFAEKYVIESLSESH